MDLFFRPFFRPLDPAAQGGRTTRPCPWAVYLWIITLRIHFAKICYNSDTLAKVVKWIPYIFFLLLSVYFIVYDI
jgi:hypothetical protein